MKEISNQNLNAYVANQKIDKAIAKAGEKSHNKTVWLCKIILRNSPSHKLKEFVPMYAFVKNAGNKTAFMILSNGVTAVMDNSQFFSVSEVNGDFTFHGVTYGIKDTVNGYPRYKVKGINA